MPLLSAAFVKKAKAKPERHEIPDSYIERLYFIVQPSGAKSWAIRYRVNKGKPRKLTLGSYPIMSLDKARSDAAKALDRVDHGIDPAAAENDDDTSLAARVALYRQLHVAKLRKGTQGYINRELDRMLALWPGKELRAIRKSDVVAFIDRAAARGDAAQNTAWQCAKAFFAWNEEKLDDFTSPARTIERPNKVVLRERVLTDAELAAVWKACPSNAAGRLCKMLMLTGARRDEMAALERSEIGADAIVIPAKRTKTGVAHEIALSPLMRHVLAGAKGNGKYALTGTDYQVNKSKRTKDEIETPGVAPWRFHDLRRSFATGLAGKPFSAPLPVIEKLLNHKLQGMLAVYQKQKYVEERRDALLAWSEHIEKLVKLPPLRVAA